MTKYQAIISELELCTKVWIELSGNCLCNNTISLFNVYSSRFLGKQQYCNNKSVIINTLIIIVPIILMQSY